MFKGLLKSYGAGRDGAFAIGFAVASVILLLAVAVAIEISTLQGQKNKTQNIADVAALSAAHYMAENIENIDSDVMFHKYSAEAKKFAKVMIDDYMAKNIHTSSKSDFEITREYAKVTLNIQQNSRMMGMFGQKKLSHQATAIANMATAESKDVDIILAADATGSMATTLTGIQDNMKEFAFDLQLELNKYDISLGNVRVKFIFFRDYMVDNCPAWTGRQMALAPGLETYGAMYESPFFELPTEKLDLDTYVDFFVAQGGGSFKESAFEAIWHALETPEWGPSEDTVRSIVLWTDATPRPFGDIEEEFGLMPSDSGYWNNAYWDGVMGPAFTALSYEQRQDYMLAEFYPPGAPTSLGQLKTQFEDFHAENASDKSGIKTMAINIIEDCWGTNPCGEWEDVKAWEGVDVIEDATVSSDETYDKIIQQVAETVLSQVSARELAITH